MDHEVGVRLKIVWTISQHGQRTYRTRIGVAWESADGALAARLDAIPVNGEILVTDWVPSSHSDAGRDVIALPRREPSPRKEAP